MKPYLAILASLLALTASAETVQQLRIINLSGGTNGIAWIDTQGNTHKFDTTNLVTEVYVQGLLEGYQIGSTILSNFVSLGNDAGLLTNDGVGNISWVITSGSGSGDFMADGSVPMTGALEMGDNALNNVSDVNCNNTVTCNAFAALGFSNIGTDTDGNSGFFNMHSGTLDGDFDAFNLYRGGVEQWFVGQGNSAIRGAVDDLLFYDLALADAAFWSAHGSGIWNVKNDIKTESGSYWCQGVIGVSGINVMCDDGNLHPIVGGIIQ